MACEEDIIAKLEEMADDQRATALAGYFKTGPGQYGHGDIFLGIRVPELRKLIRPFRSCPRPDLLKLLKSTYHEARLLTLLILVDRYRTGTESDRSRIYRDYLANTKHINNWDLVDLSAPHIIGGHLFSRPRAPLYELVESNLLWDRRIAIMATFYFIRQNDFKDALKLAGLLSDDEHDLIHKATGWMLREVGKRNRAVEEEFLKTRYLRLPRTTLRYAIEKFPEKLRKAYLNGTV